MEENSNESTFIIQTIDLTSTSTNTEEEGGLSKESVSNEAPILISTTEINNTSQYITCYENGEIVLKEIEDTVEVAPKMKKNKNEVATTTVKKVNKSPVKSNTKMKSQTQQKQHKRLCYEKPFNIQQLIKMQSKHDAPVVIKYPRKHIIDQKIIIPPREFKCQLNYTADTVTTSKLAPCTRQQMGHVLNGITTLFAHPAHKMPNANLMQLYVSRCTCKKEPNMMTTEDMDLLPLTEDATKPSTNSINPTFKRIYSKRKQSAENTTGTQKVQIIKNVSDSNINLTSIKKIYRNRKSTTETTPLPSEENQQTTQTNENIDHKYSKQITNDSDPVQLKNEEPQCEGNSIYSITLDLNDIKEENLSENQIVILSVDDNGELTENNISVLLEAATNLKTELSEGNEKEVVALTRNVGSEEFNNKLSNIFVVRTSNDNNDCEQILGDISDINKSS